MKRKEDQIGRTDAWDRWRRRKTLPRAVDGMRQER